MEWDSLEAFLTQPHLIGIAIWKPTVNCDGPTNNSKGELEVEFGRGAANGQIETGNCEN